MLNEVFGRFFFFFFFFFFSPPVICIPLEKDSLFKLLFEERILISRFFKAKNLRQRRILVYFSFLKVNLISFHPAFPNCFHFVFLFLSFYLN